MRLHSSGRDLYCLHRLDEGSLSSEATWYVSSPTTVTTDDEVLVVAADSGIDLKSSLHQSNMSF